MSKEFQRGDLRVINALDSLDFVRSRPDMFLPNGRVSGPHLLSGLVFDIVVVSNCTVNAKRHDDWWIVAAEIDWLSLDDFYIPENRLDMFRRIVPFPQTGDNTVHHEVLIAAFASDVVTASAESTDIIQGQISDALLEYLDDTRGKFGRVVAFRM